MMSQKTILSFFKQSASSSPKVESQVNDDTEKSSTKPTVSSDDDKLSSKPKENGHLGNSGTKSHSKKQRKSDSKKSKTDKNTKKSPANKNSKLSPTSKNSKASPTEKKTKASPTSKNSKTSPASKNSKASPTRKNSKTSPASKNSKASPASKNSKTFPTSKTSETSPANGISKKSVEVDESDVIDAKKTVNDINSDSPIKQPKKRKRALIIESDEESDGSEELRRNDDEEMEVDDNSETTNGVESVAADGVGKNSTKPPAKKKQATINRKSVRQSKRKKTTQAESDEEEISLSEPAKETKLEDDAVEEKSTVKDLSDNHTPILENGQKEPSTSQGTSDETTELFPKRKTARKQMRGGRSKKQLLQKAQDSIKTECENEESIALNDVASSPDIKTETEVDVAAINESTENDSESHQNDLQADEKPIKQEKEENVKSKTAIHPFFGTKKKEPETAPSVEKSNKKDTKCTSTTGTSYDPSKNRYHPIDDACWKKGEKVPYLALAKTLELIEDTSARLKIIEILSNYLRSVIVLSPEDLLYSVYLCLNRLAPEYEGIELGIGEMLLMKAVAQATGRTVEKIKAEVNVKGDLGLVAESSRGNQRIMFAPPKLTVFSVFSKFKEIAKMSGNTVMAKKVDKIQALFVACRECEAKYIIRSLSGKMRIGLAEQSVLAALARAAVLTPPNQAYPPEVIDKSSKMSADSFKEFLNEQTLILKTTYCECPNFDLVIPVLLKEGIAGLPIHCQLSPGCPLKPMLAHPTNGIDEVLNRFDKNEFTCEFKYDGERAQIHMNDKGEIKIFSRNQEDNTSKYPDIISRLPKSLKDTTKSFILDTEAVAWDCETKQILPFQVLSTRKKKDAVESDIKVHVCLMAFDLIYLNGESLVKKPLKERRELLHSSFVEVENKFMFVNYRDGNNADTMQEFLDESIKGNCEGLMVKALTVDASYEIAKRSHNWLKLKKDYLNGIGDTLDLVVIGGYHGKGKRKGTYGGFLLACYDDDNEEFQSICKLGTGFSEKELETHTNFFKDHVISEPKSYYRFDSSLEPDVWFEAVQIWEIKCADLSISPVHKAAIGIVDPEKGISLRFPRFLRIREDKSKPEDATVSSQIAEMYQNQEQVQNTKNKNMKSEEDYY